jgi:hypothetical protein
MNTHTAGDAADSLFRDVTGSVWMPGYNYDFWAIPYLLGKGMSVRNIVRFQEAVRDLMCFNSAPPAGALTAALQARRLNDLDELFAGIRLTPPRYQLAATLTRRPSR